jgi:ADP-ribose pyrophosphatase YjhB (NUDIX family)
VTAVQRIKETTYDNYLHIILLLVTGNSAVSNYTLLKFLPWLNGYMEMNFCRRCGTTLTHIESHIYKCQKDHTIFANASPASCLWIVNEAGELLVAKRAREPGLGLFDAPGGFCDGAETFEDGVFREIEEEVGLRPSDYTTPQYLLTALDTYDYAGETVDVVSGVYWARLVGNPTIRPQDDVAEAQFVAMDAIDPATIYFDAVRTGFLRLKELLSDESL